jgi:hypothetical protein
MARGDALLRKVQRAGPVYLGLELAELRKSTSIVRPAIAICISYCATLSTCADHRTRLQNDRPSRSLRLLRQSRQGSG